MTLKNKTMVELKKIIEDANLDLDVDTDEGQFDLFEVRRKSTGETLITNSALGCASFVSGYLACAEYNGLFHKHHMI